jgi:beta-lactamase class D
MSPSVSPLFRPIRFTATNNGAAMRIFMVWSSLIVVLLTHPAAGQVQRETTIPAKYFGGMTGAFVVYDVRHDTITRYNPRECATRYSPASTFKIPNSLIGLETGVIRDEHFVIPWDGVKRWNAPWNRDHDLASAIANSVVWYYQELARRVGADSMKKYVDAMRYGNQDISGGIDHFWLGSSIKISADEQVFFLRRLAEGTLPFSKRSLDIVSRITIVEQTPEYTLHGKTGFTDLPDSSVVGWFVGWVEKGNDLYCYALNLTSPNYGRDGGTIRAHRMEYALAILRDLGVLPQKRED